MSYLSIILKKYLLQNDYMSKMRILEKTTKVKPKFDFDNKEQQVLAIKIAQAFTWKIELALFSGSALFTLL